MAWEIRRHWCAKTPPNCAQCSVNRASSTPALPSKPLPFGFTPPAVTDPLPPALPSLDDAAPSNGCSLHVPSMSSPPPSAHAPSFLSALPKGRPLSKMAALICRAMAHPASRRVIRQRHTSGAGNTAAAQVNQEHMACTHSRRVSESPQVYPYCRPMVFPMSYSLPWRSRLPTGPTGCFERAFNVIWVPTIMRVQRWAGTRLRGELARRSDLGNAHRTMERRTYQALPCMLLVLLLVHAERRQQWGLLLLPPCHNLRHTSAGRHSAVGQASCTTSCTLQGSNMAYTYARTSMLPCTTRTHNIAIATRVTSCIFNLPK